MASTLKTPVIPTELWMLWNSDPETKSPWVPAIDHPNGGENYLVCTSEADAKAACEHQSKMWDIDCIPVRVK